MKEGSDAASALIWHTRKIIETLKPKICILENVKGMIMGHNLKEFHKWQDVLTDLGYTNYAKILNSSAFNVPQNRERLFMVSMLDKDRIYHFPKPMKLEKRIKDILEPYGTVDESYYFSAKQLSGMFNYCNKKVSQGCGFQTQFVNEEDIASCDTIRYGASYTDAYLKEPALKQVASLYDNNAQAGRIYDIEGISPCLDTCSGGNQMPKILTPVRTEEAKELRRKGIEVFGNREFIPREDGCSNTLTTVQKDNMLIEPAIMQRPHGWNPGREIKGISPTITISSWESNNLLREPCTIAMRGRNPQKPSDRSKGCPTEQRLEFGANVANCITTVQKDSMVAEPIAIDYKNLPDKTVLKDEEGRGFLWQDNALWRVRKLTPREVFRLQDLSEEDIDKILESGVSKTACYALAGNSITISPLFHIFRKIFIEPDCEEQQLSLF